MCCFEGEQPLHLSIRFCHWSTNIVIYFIDHKALPFLLYHLLSNSFRIYKAGAKRLSSTLFSLSYVVCLLCDRKVPLELHQFSLSALLVILGSTAHC